MPRAVPIAVLLRDARVRLATAGVPSPRDRRRAARGVRLRTVPRRAGRRRRARRRRRPGTGAALPRARRANAPRRVPLQHLIGDRALPAPSSSPSGPGVFVPRPETEVVAGRGDRGGPAGRARPLVVDLCTGSGAIAIAVAVEVPAARVVAVEWTRSPARGPGATSTPAAAAVDLRAGRRGGRRRRCRRDLAGAVDVVVANPPYIPDGARPGRPRGGRPRSAESPSTAAGRTGSTCRAVSSPPRRGLLRPGGLLVMEHGDAQGPSAQRLVGGSGAGTTSGRPRT